MARKRGPYRKRRGFYGKALEADERSAGEVDVRELKRRLIEAMRKQPGEVHLLLQGSKTLLRAEAMEQRGKPREDLAERMAAVYEALDAQIGPGALLPAE